ncbi:MAG: formylmethanofuran dehydrogenase subunit A [Candidatus Bathyarchaeia archaeon]
MVIKGGVVYDPVNKVDGEKADIHIRGGKIVDATRRGAKSIDASGMIVMPGGVDIHSHIAGAKVNAARVLRPEDHYRDAEPYSRVTRSGVGHSIPSTFTTGYRYSRMGYTTVFEPANAPLKTRHTHEELDDTPMVDKGCFTLLGDNWLILDYIREGRYEECKAYAAWMLEATKSYAVKIVNPGGFESWAWGKYITSLDETVPNFDVTPREIIRALCRLNNDLNMPHPIHVHTNNLAQIGNYRTTIDTMEAVRDLAIPGRPVIHITHVQFTGRKGTSWMNVSSGAPEIAEYVNRNSHVEIDMGQIIFGDTTTMTADGSFQYLLHLLSGHKWVNSDVEAETGAGIVPFTYRKKNYVNAVQWGIGLELALLIKDPWKVIMTSDHPNGGPFTGYPKIISWLTSKKARKRVIARMNTRAGRRLDLPDIDRELSLYEVAITTRAAPARSLGLKDKGNLAPGADADIAIYDLDPRRVDISRDYRKVRKAFSRAAYTVKEGVVVVKDGEVKKARYGKTFYCRPMIKAEELESVTSEVKDKFQQYYTVQMSNYQVEKDYLRDPYPIPC